LKIDACILIIDDDPDILLSGKLLLECHFSSITICERPESIPQLLSENKFDVIMLDMNFSPGESSGRQGYLWLEKILLIDPQAVVIMITAHGCIDVAVDTMKMGATDFIAKPWHNEKVIATLSSATQLSKARMEARELRTTNKFLAQASTKQLNQQLLGNSPAMNKVHSLIERCAPTDANVLILGENGTGKELVAREVHTQSLRCDHVFMSVDLGAISESLFESELFGHKKGAFTGANENRIGRLQAANGGTLFLDEIGNIPLHLQAKLLTVLEQRLVTPIGANAPQPFNVRVIAATNVSRQDLSLETKFRQDLLFRLNTVEISLPTIRERKADIEMIAIYYIDFYSKKYGKVIKAMSNEALSAVENYPWPGNVRALRHAIERAVILSESQQLKPADFQLNDPQIQTNTNLAMTNEIYPESNDSSNDLNLERMEKNIIGAALKKHRYNISHSAKELGLTRTTLYRRMEKYGF